jgi:hypothetical protein
VAPTDAAAVLAVLDRFGYTLRRRDAAGAFALFAPDADTVLVGAARSEVTRGAAEVRALLARLAAQVGVASAWDWRTGCAWPAR